MGLTIYIANLAGIDDNTMANIVNTLNGYWNQVVTGTDTTLTGVKAITSKTGLNASDTDLLCYVVPSWSKSVVKKFNAGIDGSSSAGYTSFTTGSPATAASEVYLDKIKGAASDSSDYGLVAANLIFHELMHNKSTTGDEMHNGQDGLGKDTVTESDTLTSTNISYVQPFLSTVVKQWKGGF